jgi:NhaP-type Na+/H+ or K+/H+ antiporter
MVLLDQRLCDCFLEYGETTAEVATLLAFVLFGAVLAGIIDTVSIPLALALAAIAIFVVRPAVLGIVLARTKMSWGAHALVSWFGPRGLNSLLLALLVVEAGVDGSELLLAAVRIVVLVSVAVHGGTAKPFSAWYARVASKRTLEEERETTAAGLFARDHEHEARVTPEELHALLAGPGPPVVLDIRSRSSYDRDGAQIPGSIRVLPDEAVEWAADQPRDRLVVAYCT